MEFVARSRQVYIKLVVEALLYLPKGKRTSIYALAEVLFCINYTLATVPMK
jgi:hypothetical protein